MVAVVSKPKRYQAAFTLVELVVVIGVVIILLAVIAWPSISAARERARRVNCLKNVCAIWKNLSGWSMSSDDYYRFYFAGANTTKPSMSLPPEILICPSAGRLCTTQPDTNCYYQYFPGLSDMDGNMFQICDMNGPNKIAGPHAWGDNHDGKGGHFIKLAGSGGWLDSANYPSKMCVTNPCFFVSFSTNTVWYLR